MNKNKVNKNQQCIPWPALFKENEEIFTQKLIFLRKLLKTWHQIQKQPYLTQLDLRSMLTQYACYIEQFYNNIDVKEQFKLNSLSYDYQLKQVKSQKQIYLRYDFFDSNIWKINFKYKFILHLSKLSQQIVRHIFVLMYIYSQGYLPFHGSSENNLRQVDYYNSQKRYYKVPINMGNEYYYLLISIGVQKIPKFTHKTHVIKQFQFQSFIQCEYIFSMAAIQNDCIIDTLKNIQSIDQFNPKFDFSKNQLIILKEQNKICENYYGNQKYRQASSNISKLYPFIYKSQFADILCTQNYQFLLKRWKFHYKKEIYFSNMVEEKKSNLQDTYLSYSKQSRKDVESRQQMEFTNTFKILDILSFTPNFKYSLTNQQRQVLSKSGNLIVVGRSGTGKTTCALYRLYGIQFYLKKRQINRIIISHQQEQKCQMMLFEELHLSKNIFLTFSANLIKQIEDQYLQILVQLKQKHAEKCLLCKDKFHTKSDKKRNDPIDQFYNLFKRQQQKIKSLMLLKKQEYPAFFTVQYFIKIIDKTVERPFYNHQLDRTNQDNQNNIKRSYINRYEFEHQKITNKETLYAILVDYDFFQRHIWNHLPKQILKVQKDFSLLTPAVVWAQIFSIIKGSLNSFTFPDGYISRKMYLQQKRNVFQNLEQTAINQIKNKVYTIFTIYQNWCKKENYYDLMDVVNHLLQQIVLFGYFGPKMNYIFIDEVQDLTTATIFLLSKLVLNNIFYCGDTAQAITKGVDFRFEDIKLIFNQDHFKYAVQLSLPSDPINLTVNFRSHNRILQLANSVISTIQEIFPKAIKKISIKQKSDLFGPKPSIIFNRIDLLLKLVCRQNYHQQNINFKRQQVIVVRNQEQKKTLPELLKAEIFTPEQIKGLEYDEVILYNFFSSCPCKEKWKILDYLFIEELFQDQQQFQEKISRRNKEEKGVEEQLNFLLKRLLEYDFDLKKYKVRKITIKQSINEVNLNYYYELISQLKILYTIITRARILLVIYDNQMPKSLKKLWDQMKLITVIDDQNINQNIKDTKTFTERQRQQKYLNQDELWEKEGIEMLSRKLYENAKHCFRKIHRYDLVERVEAMELKNSAQNQLFQFVNRHKKKVIFGSTDKMINKIHFSRKKKLILQKFKQAADIFFKYKRYEEAANAYQQAELLTNVLDCYIILKNDQKIADCFFNLREYQNALYFYQKIGSSQRIIQCLIQGELWNQFYKQLCKEQQIKNKHKMVNQNLIRICIYHVLHDTIQNPKINHHQNHFPKYKPVAQKTQQYNSSKYVNSDLLNQIQKINMKYQFLNMKKILQNIVYIYQKKKQLMINYQTQSDKLKFIQKKIYNLLEFTETKQQKLQLQNLKKQCKQNLKEIQQQEQHFYKQYEMDTIYSLSKKTRQTLKKYIQKKNKYQYKDKNAIQSELDLNLNLLQSKQLIIQNNKFCQSGLTVSISGLQQYIDTDIFGINLFQQQRNQLINSVSTIIKNSQRFFKYQRDSFYENSHHRYMEKKIIKKLYEHSHLQQTLNLYNKCDIIGQSMCNLLICDDSKELISLSLKHILGYTLVFSKVYKQNRFLKDTYNSRFKQIDELQQIQKFLIKIKSEVLTQRIPHVGLADSFYYRIVINDLVTGLILQGYFKQAIMFCKAGLCCQIAYLFSDCDLMIKQIQKISNYNNIDFPDLKLHFKYLFINEEKFFKKIPETEIINVFSTQQIFYDYDKCQQTPFLSQKFTIEKIQIQQATVQNIMNSLVKPRIQELQIYSQQLKNQREKYYQQFNHLKKEKSDYQQSIKQQLKDCRLQIYNIERIKKQNQQKTKIMLKQRQNGMIKEQQSQKCLISLQDKLKLQPLNNQQQPQDIDYAKIKQNQAKMQYQRIKNANRKLQISLNKLNKQIQSNQNQINLFNCQCIIINEPMEIMKQQINKIQQKIQHNRSKIPKEILITNPDQLQSQICKQLVEKQKQTRYKEQRMSYIDDKMNNILKRTNVAKINTFLKYYLQGSLRFKNNKCKLSYQQIEQQYIKILKDGKNLDKIEKQQQSNVKISNIIIFYLSYIFNQAFRQDIQILVNKNLQNLLKITKQIQQTNKLIKLNAENKNNISAQEEQYINKQLYLSLNKLKDLQQKYPATLFKYFLENVINRINNSQKYGKFNQFLFGFFQCRIIKNCPPLKILQEQYVLVRSNSRVMQTLKIQDSRFCYYFDHQNTIALCLFLDVQRIIINFINKQHKQLKIIHIKLTKQPIKTYKLYKKDYVQRDNQILACKNWEQKSKIEQLFKSHYLTSSIKQKKSIIKKQLMEFYFENSYENKESFHFVLHQFNEYHFIEQMYMSMRQFNPLQLIQIQKKMTNLEKQFKKWSFVAKKDRQNSKIN